MTDQEPSPPPPEDEEELSWTSHPVRRRPLAAVLTALLIVAAMVLVREVMHSNLFAVLAGVVLALSVAKFYLPTHYRMTPEKIVVKTTTQTLAKNWAQYRSCYPDKNGILLSPFAEPSRLENFRGLYVLFNRNADEVTAYVKTHIGKRPPAAAGDEA